MNSKIVIGFISYKSYIGEGRLPSADPRHPGAGQGGACRGAGSGGCPRKPSARRARLLPAGPPGRRRHDDAGPRAGRQVTAGGAGLGAAGGERRGPGSLGWSDCGVNRAPLGVSARLSPLGRAE